jgi:acetolactate synthase-1/2/3 large subunit
MQSQMGFPVTLESGADGVVEALVQAGIRFAFGIPGGEAGRIFRALNKRPDDIRTIVVHHESVASAMGETIGRLSGHPGVLIGQGPWALGLGVLGILEAKLSSSPLLILSDFSDGNGFAMHGAYQVGTGDYGAWDAKLAFMGLTKRVIEARTPTDAVHGTQLAIKHAMTGERGPVAVLFSRGALAEPVEPGSQPKLYTTDRYVNPRPAVADTVVVANAANAILHAERAVIIAGNGVRIGRAYEELRSLAELLDVPVVTTATGKGVIAETHRLARGVFGTFGTATANAVVGNADVILVVGSKLGASDTAFENPALLDPDRQTLIQIDVEPLNVSWSYPITHQLVGDAAAVLSQLWEYAVANLALRSIAAASTSGTRGENVDIPVPDQDAAGIDPRTVIHRLQKAMSSGGTVICDAGENRIFMTHFYETPVVEGFLQAAGAGPMGYAIPAAMAAKLCHPDRRIVAVTGDGGFAMTMNGLLTALEEEIPITVVVFNNAALGWSLHGGSLRGLRRKVDFASVARAMGCIGMRVSDETELDDAFGEAFRSGGKTPTVLDIDVSLAIGFADVTSKLAERPRRTA